MSLIDINDLNICYKSGKKSISALKNVNFSVNSGDYICVIGKNGAGKSTLIKSILGIIKPKSGNVIFKNLNKSDVAYVPQMGSNFENVLATVFEVVISGMLRPEFFNIFYTKKNKQDVKYYLKMLGIEKFLERKITELSGGQKKKVLLARALCSRPRVLVLDEPCANLDEDSSSEFYGILKKLNKENKITIIMVLHDEKNAKKNATKLLTLNNGSIVKLEVC